VTASPRIVALLTMPALLLIAWFVIEQAPRWLAPPPPWQRYPDLVALPGGCQAALALANAGASRTNVAGDSNVRVVVENTVSAIFPGSVVSTLLLPEQIRFGDGALGWVSLVAFEPPQRISRGALILLNSDGTPRDIIATLGGDSTSDQLCGNFAPQPRGLRAQLRPYLPLIALVGYVGLVCVGAIGMRFWRRRR
jgi:hypothetical protein